MVEQLPTRQMNAIRVLLNKHDFTPDEVAQLDVRVLLRAPGIGRKGFDIIKGWLHNHGRDLQLPHIQAQQNPVSRKLEQAILLLKRHGYEIHHPSQN